MAALSAAAIIGIIGAITAGVAGTTGTIITGVQGKRRERRLQKQRKEDIALDQNIEGLGRIEQQKLIDLKEDELELSEEELMFARQEAARTWKWKHEEQGYNRGLEFSKNLLGFFEKNEQAKNSYLGRLAKREEMKALKQQKTLI